MIPVQRARNWGVSYHIEWNCEHTYKNKIIRQENIHFVVIRVLDILDIRYKK